MDLEEPHRDKNKNRQLPPQDTVRMWEFMSKHDLDKLIHAFIFGSLDYCNGLFTGLRKKPSDIYS